MRTLLLVASLALACHSGPQEVSSEYKPEVPPPAPTPAPPPVVAPPPPPVAAPEPAPAPVEPSPTWQNGPDRYQLPTKVRWSEEEGPFCGVHVIDLAAGQVTTLLSRDRKTWVVRAGKTETPTTVEFVKTPRPAGLLKRIEPLFEKPGPGSTVVVEPAHPLVPEPFELAGVRILFGDLALLGDKLYGLGLVKETTLLEIDPKTRTFVPHALKGKSPAAVFPDGPNLALYLSGARKKSVATYDPAARKIVRELEIPRDLEPECRRTHHYYGEEEVYFLQEAGRFYVGFACFPDA